MDGEEAVLEYGPTLHCLVLGPRAAHKNFSNWMKDCLVKQGLTVLVAETLVKQVANDVNSVRVNSGEQQLLWRVQV